MRKAEVVLASDSFYADCNSSLSVACGAKVDGQNWHLLGGLFGENLLDGEICMDAGLTDVSMVALALAPLSGIL